MHLIGRIFCALGALAIVVLGVDLLTGHAGFEFPGGVLRFLILLPTAILGALIGFLMLRGRTDRKPARRAMLVGAVVPPVLAVLLFGGALLLNTVTARDLLVGVLVACWGTYAVILFRGGLYLRDGSGGTALGLLAAGVGAGLLVQSGGAAFHLFAGSDSAWAGGFSFYGLCFAGACMAAVLAILALAGKPVSRSGEAAPRA